MTTPAFAPGLGGRRPSPDERAAAARLREILAARGGEGATLSILGDDGSPDNHTPHS